MLCGGFDSASQALKRTSNVVMPANRQEDMDRMARRWGQMTQELGRVPTLDEVAAI